MTYEVTFVVVVDDTNPGDAEEQAKELISHRNTEAVKIRVLK